MTGAVYLIVLGVVVAGYIWWVKEEYERQLGESVEDHPANRPTGPRVIP